jgi:hypothetical protein
MIVGTEAAALWRIPDALGLARIMVKTARPPAMRLRRRSGLAAGEKNLIRIFTCDVAASSLGWRKNRLPSV